ncbi:30S ribosomal protein S1 [Caulifigura coniformis]|uniref:30S ribosomal protein S1 n=1 Tax=Caulifigura coniformis TaxID=2527983 RepID=A0A517S7U2_9PLAN|nr:S1 RNA-binding domain-containing protein [Caulifigura coniformis]QDT52200.1 30S ribosomal protein S1 [Caulifigura coniformis]
MSSEPGTGATQESATPVQSDEASAVAVASAAETSPEAAAAGEAQRPKVRLNPAADPGQLKARPSIDAPEASASEPAAADVPAEEALAAAAKAEVTMSSLPPAPPARAVEIPRDVSLDADTEAAIAAAIAGGGLDAQPVPVTPPPSSTEEADADAPPASDLASGTKLTGTVQTVHGDNVFLDFGLRTTGVVSLRQFPPAKPPQAGDKVDVVVDRVDEKDGLALCNLPRGRSKVSGDWDAISVGQVVDCFVEKTNKGGLEVKCGSLRGFMPASQVEMGYVATLDSYVGQKFRAQVTEVKPARRRLILSRRAIIAEEREAAEKEAMQNLGPGQSLTGRVKTIKDYGAFIDLGGVDGFLHIGQMSWVRINHPSEILKEGQQVEVQVLSVDKDTKKISLGMRQLSANPWSLASDKYAKGTNVTGKVTRVEPFGAFIELEPGVEGLVHISELDHKRIKRVTEVLDVGQMVEVQCLEVDPGRKRISLSVKALRAKPEAPPKPQDEDLAPGKGEVYQRKTKGPLKGGMGGTNAGGLFGNPGDFAR